MVCLYVPSYYVVAVVSEEVCFFDVRRCVAVANESFVIVLGLAAPILKRNILFTIIVDTFRIVGYVY